MQEEVAAVKKYFLSLTFKNGQSRSFSLKDAEPSSLCDVYKTWLTTSTGAARVLEFDAGLNPNHVGAEVTHHIIDLDSVISFAWSEAP